MKQNIYIIILKLRLVGALYMFEYSKLTFKNKFKSLFYLIVWVPYDVYLRFCKKNPYLSIFLLVLYQISFCISFFLCLNFLNMVIFFTLSLALFIVNTIKDSM